MEPRALRRKEGVMRPLWDLSSPVSAFCLFAPLLAPSCWPVMKRSRVMRPGCFEIISWRRSWKRIFSVDRGCFTE